MSIRSVAWRISWNVFGQRGKRTNIKGRREYMERKKLENNGDWKYVFYKKTQLRGYYSQLVDGRFLFYMQNGHNDWAVNLRSNWNRRYRSLLISMHDQYISIIWHVLMHGINPMKRDPFGQSKCWIRARINLFRSKFNQYPWIIIRCYIANEMCSYF